LASGFRRIGACFPADETVAVDIKTLKVTARVKVGYVPKRNGTLLLSRTGTN